MSSNEEVEKTLEQLHDTLEIINQNIARIEGLAAFQGVKPKEILGIDGSPLITGLLVAKAQCLSAISLLEEE